MVLLEGIRVIDFTTHAAGPFCTRLLGELGAEVIKVERPVTGDVTRFSPFSLSQEHGWGAMFLIHNSGKKSIAMDLRKQKCREVILNLVRASDVVVQNARPGAMDRLGLGYTKLSLLNPAMVMCSISGYGQFGPQSERIALDTIVQASTGLMDVTGPKNGPPMKAGFTIGDSVAALTAVAAICAALAGRHANGKGQHIDVGMQDALLAVSDFAAIHWMYQDFAPQGIEKEPTREGNRSWRGALEGNFQCTDGSWVHIVARSDDAFHRLASAMGQPGLATDPRFATAEQRMKNRDAAYQLIQAWVGSFSSAEKLDEVFREYNLLAAVVTPLGDVLRSENTAARQMVTEMDLPGVGNVSFLRSAFKFSNAQVGFRARPPLLGEHTVEVLRDLLGYRIPEVLGLLGDGSIDVHPSVVEKIAESSS